MADAFNPNDITGAYDDPFHPGCDRFFKVLDDTTKGEVTGNDKEDGSKPWGPYNATINGTTVVVDFSPKGGPKDLTGEYSAPAGEKAGITWADGNRWTKKE